MAIIPKSFFERQVTKAARDLVGCHLVRRSGRRNYRCMITDAEAYDGTGDLACHASKGRTPRNKIMFGPPGHAYVYFVYGMHWMLNIVAGPHGYPAGILIRGVVCDLSDKKPGSSRHHLKGPAILTKKLGIIGKLNGKKLGRSSGLWVEPRDRDFDQKKIKASPRIGVEYAGPIWSKKKWRFHI